MYSERLISVYLLSTCFIKFELRTGQPAAVTAIKNKGKHKLNAATSNQASQSSHTSKRPRSESQAFWHFIELWLSTHVAGNVMQSTFIRNPLPIAQVAEDTSEIILKFATVSVDVDTGILNMSWSDDDTIHEMVLCDKVYNQGKTKKVFRVCTVMSFSD
jgi:hypothetical protein